MSFRLLHLSDLHLGQRFHDQDRSEEEKHALDQVVELCRDHRVDVVILAGDIFDTANPGAKESERYHQFLARLVLDVKVGTVVIIAGNHDNATRIEGPRELYKQCNIHTLGNLRLADDPQTCFIPLRDRSENPLGTCVALPYLRDADVRQPVAGETQGEAASAHRQAVSDRMANLLAEVPKGQPFVVTGHAFCTNAVEAGDERPVQVGNLGTIPASTMAGEAAYLALGHLHRPQALAGQEHWRYSGSLLPTGFDEIDIHRSVVIAEVPDIGPATVQIMPLKAFRRYKAMAGTVQEVMDQIKNLEEPAPDAPSPWAWVNVTDRSITSGLPQYLTEQVRSKGWQLLGVRIKIKGEQQGASEHPEAEVPPDDILNDPEAVFVKLLEQSGTPEEDRLDLKNSFAALRERCDELLEDEES